jgi:hypothetical protein
MLSNVTLIAQLRNTGTEPIVLAHPNACFPKDYELGDTIHVSVRYEKSEIIISITRPDGSRVYLRNNMLRGFEPNGGHYLYIDQGESVEILLGWLGPDFSLGQWEVSEDVFFLPGIYTAQVTIKNLLPKAIDNDKVGNWFLRQDIWMGETVSNTVEIAVH